ncbi:MAG: hypothetical protein QW638_00435 [Candidatus Bathyarchaeia archaeon]|nr:hypothetical protein [Candidatus Bathyarchaeota archaeon]
MRTLFIIGSIMGSKMVFQIAREIKGRGSKVILVFRGEGVRFIDHPRFGDETGFSDEVYVLRDGSKPSRGIYPKTISPDELVEIMESCKRVISWV